MFVQEDDHVGRGQAAQDQLSFLVFNLLSRQGGGVLQLRDLLY